MRLPCQPLDPFVQLQFLERFPARNMHSASNCKVITTECEGFSWQVVQRRGSEIARGFLIWNHPSCSRPPEPVCAYARNGTFENRRFYEEEAVFLGLRSRYPKPNDSWVSCGWCDYPERMNIDLRSCCPQYRDCADSSGGFFVSLSLSLSL